jgi:prepilin-type N-terminal cleavage/methylation domain-containing protein
MTVQVRRPNGRRGVTLIEMMVAIAIMIMFVAVLGPTMSGMLMLKQRQAARDLALTYAQMHDEAILRNRTFRIAYHLDDNYYEVQAGSRDALIFADAESREAVQDRLEDQKEDMTEEEWKEFQEKNSYEAVEGYKVELPPNTHFKSVYTPQYEDPLTPRSAAERERDAGKSKDDQDGPRVAFSHVFANGFAEYTVVQIVDDEDKDEGFTITVDPMSGRVDLYSELVDLKDAFDDLPDEGPRLP